MQVIKVKFTRGNVAYGRAYSYYAEDDIKVDDIAYLPLSAYSNPEDGHPKGLVIQVGVPEEEVASFKDSMKSIIGKAAGDEEAV